MEISNNQLVRTCSFDVNRWKGLLELSVEEVFEMMVGTPVTTCAEFEPPLCSDFTATVGLAGSICGVLSVRCGRRAAQLTAAGMLGVSPEQVGDDAWDALGEVANIVAGNFKAKLSGLGNQCMLSVPTVIGGADYQLRSMGAVTAIESMYRFEGDFVWVTLEIHN